MSSTWTLLSWGPEGWLDDIAYGVFITISLAVVTLPIGLFIGFLVALAKQSSEASLRLAGNIYTTIFRGLPELLTLFIIFFGLQIGLQNLVRYFDPTATIDVNAFMSGVIALSLVFSSYASEVFLSAFRAIPRGQYEGGFSIGLSSFQTMRLVIIPQLVRIALPGLENLWLILLKDTALISAVGLTDIMRQAIVAARVTNHALLFFGVITLLYLALTIVSSFGFKFIEHRVRRQDAAR